MELLLSQWIDAFVIHNGDKSLKQRSHCRQPSHSPADRQEYRNRAFNGTEEGRPRHLGRDGTEPVLGIKEVIPRFGIDIYSQPSAGFKLRRQAQERSVRIWRVLENAKAVHIIETARLKRQGIDVSLYDMQVGIRVKIPPTGINCVRLINRKDLSVHGKRHFATASGPATDAHNPTPGQTVGIPTG